MQIEKMNSELIKSGKNFLGILNDIKRRPEDAANELGIPLEEIKLAKLPSVIPSPPGIIEIDPKIIDAEYMYVNWKYEIKSIPNPKNTKYTENASIKR